MRAFEKFKKRKDKCRKVRFRNRFEAKKRARDLNMRAYPCNKCNGWHLTSQVFDDRNLGGQIGKSEHS